MNSTTEALLPPLLGPEGPEGIMNDIFDESVYIRHRIGVSVGPRVGGRCRRNSTWADFGVIDWKRDAKHFRRRVVGDALSPDQATLAYPTFQLVTPR